MSPALILLLAAGGSTRMGRAKQLLTYRGSALPALGGCGTWFSLQSGGGGRRIAGWAMRRLGLVVQIVEQRRVGQWDGDFDPAGLASCWPKHRHRQW